ncbi:hypothetical protein UC35_03875 [Ramlibacter tataouinensis]|uniref:Thioredoxin-like fold domain-containing protein n=2 Tax=Ramlibacter tataouinensis TaxID=94132 RepID=A0A127JZ80_9BURK|nr:hypothetical protein UC35_03875 [Ramlibacter tataouinensis]
MGLTEFPLWAGANDGKAAGALPQPKSLATELERALAARKALVLLVSLEGCPYCNLVRGSYLAPLREQGQPVAQIEWGRATALADLQGRASTHDAVVRAFGVRLAPTVLFLGRGGKEAARRLAGMAIPDFYGAYLSERVESANREVAA